MFTVKVKSEILQHCQRQIDRYNFGQRSIANGNREQQLTGIIGQCVVMEMFGQGYIDGATGCDDGTDISVLGYSIDVKTMGRTTDVRPNYVNNFIGLQLKFSTDLFIFCSYHKLKNEVTVCGWIPKADFLQKASFFPKGSTRTRSDGSSFTTFADLYEIRNDLLNDVNSPEALKQQVEQWCRSQKPTSCTAASNSSRPIVQSNNRVVPSPSSFTEYTSSSNTTESYSHSNPDSDFGCGVMAFFVAFFGMIGGAGSASWGGAFFGAIIGVAVSIFLINRNKN